MSDFSNRWGLPSSKQEENLRCRRAQRNGNAAPCRARLEGWIRNVAARSPIWGDVDLAAFCRITGYSREHATRELADIRRDHPELAFETKLRCKKRRRPKRWGVIVAERRKLCFDGRSLFYDVRGRRLHNYTTLGRDGEKIVPTVNPPETARRSRGRPRQHPAVMDALLKEWHRLTGVRDVPGESSRADSVCVNVSDTASVSNSDKAADSNSELCDGPYIRKDSFGIQQKDLYGARRFVAHLRDGREADVRTNARSRLCRKAFSLLSRLRECHYDNCKVRFASRTAYRYALRALQDGHDQTRIVGSYEAALFVCHGFAVDRAAHIGKVVHFNLSSTVSKARKLLAKDGLSRPERVGKWYGSNPRRAEISPPPFLTIEEIRAQILATFPRD